MREYAAVDLGASNGRTILGRFDGKRITINELNRFENGYVQVGGGYYWDILHLYSRILSGLKGYVKAGGAELVSIGIDTWGVDFGLLDKQGRLIGNPHSYRDPRGAEGQKAFFIKYGQRAAFDLTGIANLEFNTLYQLYDMAQAQDQRLAIADKMLMIPDLLGYMLCGVASTEYTNATTTQLLDTRTGNWCNELIEMTGIPQHIFTGIQKSGEEKGAMYASVRRDVGLKNSPRIVCVGSHDTASAVASIPATGENYAFISSGTWSLMGVVSDKGVINDAVFTGNLSNEGTVTGGVRLLKNIMGLWIIQSCKAEWDKIKPYSWDDIEGMAMEAPAFRSLIDVNAHEFFGKENMPAKIQQFCVKTGQPVPQTTGEIARTVYESLAMSYRETFADLENLRKRRLDVLHIVGGGSKNRLLNQLTASAVGREVIAGPAEATAVGNLLVQVMASGEINGPDDMRRVVRDSFEVESFEPQNVEQWSEQYERYMRIKGE